MESALLGAALAGDLPDLKELLRMGFPANAKNEVKATHLSVYIQTLSSSMFP